MIFDRTQADVNAAISIRENKVKKFAELTEEEIVTLERGTMTINTLNRIENKQSELKGLFNSMGYWGFSVSNKSWQYNDIFSEADFNRIIKNLNALKGAFFVYSHTPGTPTAYYGFKEINSLEKILYDLDVMINDVKSHYRECGTFNCGEE